MKGLKNSRLTHWGIVVLRISTTDDISDDSKYVSADTKVTLADMSGVATLFRLTLKLLNCFVGALSRWTYICQMGPLVMPARSFFLYMDCMKDDAALLLKGIVEYKSDVAVALGLEGANPDSAEVARSFAPMFSQGAYAQLTPFLSLS
jgi:hypothetical protein